LQGYGDGSYLSNEMLHAMFGFTVRKLWPKIAPKQSKSAKICPKTITLRNFEIPPKIEILIFIEKNNSCV
jgi:hypothetical protein